MYVLLRLDPRRYRFVQTQVLEGVKEEEDIRNEVRCRLIHWKSAEGLWKSLQLQLALHRGVRVYLVLGCLYARFIADVDARTVAVVVRIDLVNLG